MASNESDLDKIPDKQFKRISMFEEMKKGIIKLPKKFQENTNT